ncbi:MAG: hypothetical protein ACREJ2_00500, partial [Planctomycetota bacterium]
MGATRLFWKIYPIFLVVIVIALGAVTVESRYALQAAYLDQLGEDLKAHLKLLEEPVRTGLGLGDTAGLTADCRRWSAAGSGRITVLGRDGAVLADGGAPSAKPARSMADRPEVVEALATGQGSATRYSLQDGQDMLFVAQRVDQDGRPLGLV